MIAATRYLETFLAICEEGGFHRAAARLHLSQPTVTYQMRLLERMLKVKLFERAGRGVILTDRGRLLRDYSRRAVSDLAALSDQLLRGDERFQGTLRIASVSGFGRYVLFPILREHFSSMRVDLRFPTQDQVLTFVSAGVCDLGLIYESKVSAQLACHAVAEEELVLVGAAGMLKAPFDLERIAALPFVTYEESDYVFGRWFSAAFGRQPRSLTSCSHFEELEEVMALVKDGRGLSILPDHCVAEEVRAGTLRIARPRKGKPCINRLFAVTRAGAEPFPAVDELLQRIRTVGSGKHLRNSKLPPAK